MDRPKRLALRSSNRVAWLLTIAAAALCITLVTAPAAQAAGLASGNQRGSGVDLLQRARQLAEGVRHQGPVSLLGEAPALSRGALAGSVENRTWRLHDRGGTYELTTGVFGSLRTVTILEADAVSARVGQPVGITAWYLDPARGLRVVDVRRMTAKVHGGKVAIAAQTIYCNFITGSPYISWPYGPYINGYSYISCQRNVIVTAIALIVVVDRIQAPWGLIQIAGGGGVARPPWACVGSYCTGGAASTPCHVGGQSFFATEVVAVVYSSNQPPVQFGDGSAWSTLWCSNPW